MTDQVPDDEVRELLHYCERALDSVYPVGWRDEITKPSMTKNIASICTELLERRARDAK